MGVNSKSNQKIDCVFKGNTLPLIQSFLLSTITTLLSIIIFLQSCQTDPSLNADEIIEKSIEAYGGKENLRNVQSKVTTGTTLIYINDTLLRANDFVSMEKASGKNYYMSPVAGPKYHPRIMFVSNGESSWTQNDGALAPYMMPEEEHIDMGKEDYPYLLSHKERGIQTTYVQTVYENNFELLLVKYTHPNGKEENVYFDANTMLIHKVKTQIQTSQGLADKITSFYDFREVEGLKIPFRTEAFFPPRELDQYLINTLEINKNVDDDIFEFKVPSKAAIETAKSLVGSYRFKGGSLNITFEDQEMFVSLNGKEKTLALVVEGDFIMFRDGLGAGSRIGNIQLIQNESNKKQLELTLRKQKYIANEN